jgi:hypothetical protein
VKFQEASAITLGLEQKPPPKDNLPEGKPLANPSKTTPNEPRTG